MMQRFQKFMSNAGVMGTLQTAIVTFGIVTLVAVSFQAGDAHWTVPAVLFAVAFGFATRGILVEHLHLTRRVMNLFAIAAIIGIILFRPHFDAENFLLRFIVVVLATLYIGCYFWVLSDPDIVRE